MAEHLRGEVRAGAVYALKLGVWIRGAVAGVAPPVPVAPAFADASRAQRQATDGHQGGGISRPRSRTPRASHVRPPMKPAPSGPTCSSKPRTARPIASPSSLPKSARILRPARQRLYLETLAMLLPRFARKIVVARGQDLDLSLFQSTPAEPVPVLAPASGAAR